jgi:hypothetical protein
MKHRHLAMILLFAMLQGMAPLLHAHLGGDKSVGGGVHLHTGAHAPSPAQPVTLWSDAGPIESPAVGLGQELRRDSSWQPLDAVIARVVAWFIPSRPAPGAPRESTAVRDARAGNRLLPPAQAPPARAA